MPDYVEALRILSRLPNNLNGLFMEQETKTVTIPLSEYNQMLEDIMMLKTKNGVDTLKELQKENKDLKEKVSLLNGLLNFTKASLNSVLEENEKLKQKKWWQFWK